MWCMCISMKQSERNIRESFSSSSSATGLSTLPRSNTITPLPPNPSPNHWLIIAVVMLMTAYISAEDANRQKTPGKVRRKVRKAFQWFWHMGNVSESLIFSLIKCKHRYVYFKSANAGLRFNCFDKSLMNNLGNVMYFHENSTETCCAAYKEPQQLRRPPRFDSTFNLKM